ncbi:MAG: hypothetical protein IKO07_07675 [Clostridia bacterium]|nr:hypothetical protein [Clostridia bacterium]
MKKIAWLLALMFLFASLAALAEAPAAIDNPTLAFAGRWADPNFGRASLRIAHVYFEDAPEDELDYDVKITWGNTYNSVGVWQMTARWDEASGKLVYENGVMSIVTADDEGEGGEEVLWDDAAGAFFFAEDGTLRWEDSREERAAEFRLERVVTGTPAAGDFADKYFLPVANVEFGTAGSSLKQAILARDVVRFAYDNDLWNTDIGSLREAMLAAWESLDDDARARFDENLMGVVGDLANGIFWDYDSLAGRFEDAGVGEDAAFLSADTDASLSWATLFANTLTIGNSED